MTGGGEVQRQGCASFRIGIRGLVEIVASSVETGSFAYTAAGTSEWGTARRNAGLLLR
jgi:N12 class adenine-specific DNA methylase